MSADHETALEQAAYWKAAYERMAARNVELSDALEPFAKLADEQLADGGPILGHYLIVRRVPIAFGGEHDIRPGDLRTARRLVGGSS